MNIQINLTIRLFLLKDTNDLLDMNPSFQFTHKNKTYAGTQAGPKINLSSIIHAAKKNDYERKRLRAGITLFKLLNISWIIKCNSIKVSDNRNIQSQTALPIWLQAGTEGEHD